MRKRSWVVVGILGAFLAVVAMTSASSQVHENAIFSPGHSSFTETTSKEAAAPTKPDVVVKTETKDVAVPYQIINRDDNTIAKGTSKVVQEGVDGLRSESYEVTYVDGVETSRELVSEEVVREPVTKIIANGTYVAPPKPAPTPDTSCANGAYTNTAGQLVCRPSAQNTGGATAVCWDGTYSYSRSRKGTCSHHGGVRQWL